GTWVVPMDQEFGELLRALWDAQVYPDMGGDPPYDAGGWTLPFQLNVNVVAAKEPLSPEFRAALAPVEGTPTEWRASPEFPFTTNKVAAGIVAAPSRFTGSGDQIALDPQQTNSFKLMNRALASRATIRYTPPSATRGARYVVGGVSAAAIDSMAKDLFIQGERTTAAAGVVAAPTRVALYKASAGNMDEGWTEWLFDTYG